MVIRLTPANGRPLFAAVWITTGMLILNGCASNDTSEKITADTATPPAQVAEAEPAKTDRFEGFNRSMYKFNLGLDKYFFKPVSDGYKFVTPDFVETGVSNFFTNLKGINVFLNDFLQGKFEQGAADTGRFLTNTTLGVAGLVDVASELGLEPNVEDFGQTLATWGVGEGPYLVLPIMGPTTVRDGSGSIFDRAANPGTYVPFTGVIEGISDRAKSQGTINFIDEAALDPYVFTRESFLQYRRHLINDGETDTGSDPDDLNSALDEAAAPKQEPSVPAATVSESVEKSPAESKPAEAVAAQPHYDAMVESFEKASAKVDQLGELSKHTKRSKHRKHR